MIFFYFFGRMNDGKMESFVCCPRSDVLFWTMPRSTVVLYGIKKKTKEKKWEGMNAFVSQHLLILILILQCFQRWRRSV